METKKQSNSWVWVVVIILVIVALFFLFRDNKSDDVVANNSTDTQTVLEPESVQDTTGQVAPAVGATLISYANALTKYADRRIQLDKNCQAFPNTVTYKDKTGIMIDNRSALTRKVKVGTTFTIKPYGFKIVTLPDIYLKSKTLLVDCDKSQNVATILVQE